MHSKRHLRAIIRTWVKKMLFNIHPISPKQPKMALLGNIYTILSEQILKSHTESKNFSS